MRFVDEFRDHGLARGLARAIAGAARPDRTYRFMEFCGGHTHAVARHGIADLMPEGVRFLHGPGCPVCVLPSGRVDAAIALAQRPGVTLVAYGDVLRVPGARRDSLLKARARGADIRMAYSCDEALRIAQHEPHREVVFFAIGFETTTPPTAAIIQAAERLDLANLSVFCNHVLTPPAMARVLETRPAPLIDGFIGPSHVSAVIGSRPYEIFAGEHGRPVVIAGFEPLDVMQSVLMLIRQINEGRAEVENQYTRAVSRGGNLHAQALVAEVFERRESFPWRGLGDIPESALRIRPRYARFDAERRFDIPIRRGVDHKGCACGEILAGRKEPADCKLFAGACTPDHPLGACMVSSEGSCAAAYTYGHHRLRSRAALGRAAREAG